MKLSKYNIIVKREYGLLLYNSRTTKYVKIKSENDIEHFKKIMSNRVESNDNMVRALYSRGFIVDDDCNEYLDAKRNIEEYFKSRESRYAFMIYVTEHCNFRCIYCPQSHKPKVFSKENWAYLYKFIENKILNEELKELNISFFGGEPLLEFNNIITFLEKLKILKEKYTDIIFQHEMTTNGYLLTKNIYDQLVKHGLKVFQITVDGFAETHDKMRPRVDGSKTWNTIIKNLEYINTKNDDAKIIIRMNYNKSNIETIQQFFEFINNKFSNKKFIFDTQPITEFSDNVNKDLADNSTKSEKSRLQNDMNKFERNKENILNPLRKLSSICKCAYVNNYTISTDGLISKCEQYYDDNTYSIGHLEKDHGIKFNNELIKWQYNFELEECKDCIMYPLCAARSCPARKVFDPINRSDCSKNIIDVKQAIIQAIEDGALD